MHLPRRMLFDHAYNKHDSEGALAFLIEILQSSTEYSLIVTDLAGTILLWNEGARRLYGYDPVEVIGRAKSEVLHSPEDIAAGLPTAMREEALRHGKWEGTVSRVRKNALIDRIARDEFSKEDERLTAILAAQVGRIYQNGSLYSDVLSHAADLEREISARKQTEEALAERVRQGALIGEVDAALTQSDSQGEMLVRCAKALVRHLDAALARIWTFNEAGSSLELKASATIDADLEDFDFDWPEAAIARMAHEQLPYFANNVLNERNVGGNVKSGRVSVPSFAGYPLMVESRLVGDLGVFTSAPLSGATLDVIGVVAPKIALGIERFRASETLREREEHIRLLLDSTAEAIYGIDLEGRCTFANSTCARLLGYADTKQLLGRNMHSLIHHTRSDGSPYESEECRIFRAFRQNQGGCA